MAVVTNGSAVLGLGNIGPLAGKPVMEGKGVLFKRFADIDVFDLELAASDPQDVIRACQMLEPTFGGINLEDIKAPDCFVIEEELRRTMRIPVFHDDQHGTAIIVGAALINALILVNKKIGDVKAVCSGAGAALLACAEHAIQLGHEAREHPHVRLSRGDLRRPHGGMNPYKARFARKTEQAHSGRRHARRRRLHRVVGGQLRDAGHAAGDGGRVPSCSRWRIPIPKFPMTWW